MTGMVALSAARSWRSFDEWYVTAPGCGSAQLRSVTGREPVAGASADELEVTTERSMPAIRAASSKPCVPRMFTSAIVVESRGENEYSAAVWMRYRHPRSAATNVAGVRRSPRTVTTPGSNSSGPRTRARTRYPRASNACNTCDPTNPEAPVRKTSPSAGAAAEVTSVQFGLGPARAKAVAGGTDRLAKRCRRGDHRRGLVAAVGHAVAA